MIERGDSELDLVLDSIFPEVRRPRARARPPRPGLGGRTMTGSFESLAEPGEDNTELIAYGGALGLQQGGLAGRAAALLAGIDPAKCPPWLTPECMEVLSRMIEQTFRNFQQHSRLPSHINPPFSSRVIDAFPAAGSVSVPGGGYGGGTFTDICSFQMPTDGYRGAIVAAGQALESPAAFSDVSWRIMLNGKPLDPYTDIRLQLWLMAPPSPLQFISLREGNTVTLQAASLSASAHTAVGRLVGWLYPTRSEEGEDIRSTIVD